MLVLLNRLWTEDNVSFAGRYYQYDNVTISPKPKQASLPLWIGGSSDAAIERTAKYGTGWLAGSAQSPAQVGRVIAAIKERAIANGRHIDPDHFGCGVALSFRQLGRRHRPAQRRNLEGATRAEATLAPTSPSVAPTRSCQMVKVLVAVGASKFVLRPLATDDDDMIEQTRRLNYEVIPDRPRSVVVCALDSFPSQDLVRQEPSVSTPNARPDEGENCPCLLQNRHACIDSNKAAPIIRESIQGNTALEDTLLIRNSRAVLLGTGR